MKVLFLSGIGVSFGEIYVAVQAARHLRAKSHDVSFAFVSESPRLIKMVRQSGFEVRYDLGLPPLEENYFSSQIQQNDDFLKQLNAVLAGPEDVIYLVDYQHFFVSPSLFPNYSQYFHALQERLSESKKATYVNDHSLWTLPFDFLKNRVQTPPAYLKKIFLPAPPHYHRYPQLSSSHEHVFFFDDLLSLPPNPRPKTGKFKLLLSISHFSLPLSDNLPVVPVKDLLVQVLSGLSKLSLPVYLTVTGFGYERLQGVKIPSNVFLTEENQMSVVGFDDYDRLLSQFSAVVLFNRVSTTITRCFFFGIPVLLINHSEESARERGTRPFDIYPAAFPTMDLIGNDNPFFDHCYRSDLFDDESIEENLKQIVNAGPFFFSERARNFLGNLPSPNDFF